MTDLRAIIEMMPQKPPFLFVTEILSLSEDAISATCHFQGTEFFYSGHFPGDPITPGVILIEAMAQVGLVALGMYLLRDDGKKFRTLFTDCAIDFNSIVRPNTTVLIEAEKVLWRRMKLRSKVSMTAEGVLVASGTVSGQGVQINEC